VLVSKYGFNDVLSPGRSVVDPSRVAAQILTGIGFIGAGLIFVRRNSVHGLTTAAGVWLTAAVGAAAGAGLPVIAALGTAGYFFVPVALRALGEVVPRSSTAVSTLRVRYHAGQGTLRRVLDEVSGRGSTVDEFSTGPAPGGGYGALLVELTIQLHGRRSVNDLAAHLAQLDGVDGAAASDIEASGE
jgi:putative Mg2+ transporter-C (MgtC) family protein